MDAYMAAEVEWDYQDKAEDLLDQLLKICKSQSWKFELKIQNMTGIWYANSNFAKGHLTRNDNRTKYKLRWIQMAPDVILNTELELYKATAEDGEEYFVYSKDWVAAVEKLSDYNLVKLELATNMEKKKLKPHITNPTEVIWKE